MAHFLIFVPAAAALSLSLSWGDSRRTTEFLYPLHRCPRDGEGAGRGGEERGGDGYRREGECQPATDTATDAGESRLKGNFKYFLTARLGKKEEKEEETKMERIKGDGGSRR